jgi:Circularly permutated YpsA SLOG family
MTLTIVSGGQTGADRAGLDFAIYNNIPHRGWCPKGRKAEDGKISIQYQLQETPSADYLQRTEWNARDSDGTVIFTMGKELTGGSKRTAEFASKHGKPMMHLYPGAGYGIEKLLVEFVSQNSILTLNVAGTRGSKEPEVYRFALETLQAAFAPHPSSWIGGSGEG